MRRTQKILLGLSLGVSFLATSCGTIDRSYLAEMDRDSDGFFQAGRDFPVVGGDSGQAFRSMEEINKRTPASERKKKQDKENLSLKEELAEKEASLSEEEMAQYSKNMKYLTSISDKLYYLSLNADEKNTYIQTRKEEDSAQHVDAKEMARQRSVHASEIFVGMSKDEVIKAWGRPTKVQIAGNPRYQNELWMFNEDGSVKQIFFEGGRVNGWALDL